MGMAAPSGLQLPDKHPPKPSVHLKSFNWSILPARQLKDTIWPELDDDRLHGILNHALFDQHFSAYQHKDNGKGSATPEADTARAKELSLLDARRGQNCTILLSRLKLSNREVRHIVLSMDEEEVVTTDMIEQLLKYTPQAEEVSALTHAKDQLDMFAVADRFIWDMAKIPRYEQRLKTLYYIRKFFDRMESLQLQMKMVATACQQLMSSPGFKLLLELTLALGNYMNRGARGNVHGFRLGSLLKLGDTKSSQPSMVVGAGQFTLIHYMAKMIDQKVGGALRGVAGRVPPLSLPSSLASPRLASRHTALTVSLAPGRRIWPRRGVSTKS